GVGLGFGLGFGFRLVFLLAAALEIGGVPTAALKLEAGRAEQLLVGRLAARRAGDKQRLGDLLQVLVLMAARLAAVFVDRHCGDSICFRREYRLPCRRTCPPASSRPAWPRRRASRAARRASRPRSRAAPRRPRG